MNGFVPFPAGVVLPLGNTLAKPGQGVAGTADFEAGAYPACSRHGAMNKVAPTPLWRCPACNIGVEIIAEGKTWAEQLAAFPRFIAERSESAMGARVVALRQGQPPEEGSR